MTNALLRIANWLTDYYPRLLALVWAGWVAATALAYGDTTPEQLSMVDRLIPGPLWIMWVLSAGCLFIGALVPPHLGTKVARIGRFLRVVGISITSMLLIMWTFSFILDGGRSWVSAKNYAILFAMACFTSFILGRDRGPDDQTSRGENV